MKSIILALDEFIDSYLLNSNIKSVTFDTEKQKWIVTYHHGLKDDEFIDTETMIMFFQTESQE